MYKLEKVTLIPVSSEHAQVLTEMLNRVFWRDKWEFESVKEVEKKLKEVKYHEYKKPFVLVRRNSDSSYLGYFTLHFGEFGSTTSFQAYPDPADEFDEACWLETIEYIVRFIFEKKNWYRSITKVVPEYDQLVPLYKKVGFVSCGIEPKARFVQGRFVDMELFECILENPFPVTTVELTELSGAGGWPPDWRKDRGGGHESP